MGKQVLDRLWIGGYEYEIVEDQAVLEGNRMAEIHLLHGKIMVAPNLHPAVYCVAVTHEYEHGRLWQAGVKEHDETHIEVFANSVIPLHRDNPKLSEMILACATRQPKRNPTRK